MTVFLGVYIIFLPSFLLLYWPLLASFYTFSCSWASSLGSCTHVFRYPNTFFFFSTICDCMVQSPFFSYINKVKMPQKTSASAPLLIYEFLTILSLSCLKCGFLTCSYFQLFVLLLFLACSHCRIEWLIFSWVPCSFSSLISSSPLVGVKHSDRSYYAVEN